MDFVYNQCRRNMVPVRSPWGIQAVTYKQTKALSGNGPMCVTVCQIRVWHSSPPAVPYGGWSVAVCHLSKETVPPANTPAELQTPCWAPPVGGPGSLRAREQHGAVIPSAVSAWTSPETRGAHCQLPINSYQVSTLRQFQSFSQQWLDLITHGLILF